MDKDEFIYGTRTVIEAIKTGRQIDKVLIKKGLNNPLFQELFQHIKNDQIPFQYVPLEKINRITRKNHQGVVALLSPIEYHHIENLLPGIYESGQDPFILILDEITDVRNFGAIVRSAECAGVHAIVVPEKGMARIGSDAIKTSAGALHHVPVCRVANINQTINFLKNSGIKIVTATEKAQKLYFDSNLKSPVAIVMGSEEKGISKSILLNTDENLKIPLFGNIESLNVSVAAAVIMYEVVRQRN